MILFNETFASPEKSEQENIKLLITSYNDMVYNLNLLSQQVDAIQNKLESEGK